VEFETRAIHEGQQPDPATGALTPPIYQTSTYVHEEVGVHKGYDYSRVSNPTRTALQTVLASLEGAEFGAAYSSGIGATTTLMHLVNPGERVVCVNDVYGGVYRMFSQVYEPKGYAFEFVPAEEINTNLSAHLDERTRIVWLETPTNPMLNVVDIRAAADAAHQVGAIVVVDNTFASPYLQRPLEHGADVVLHSATKYLGGHSDALAGALVFASEDERDRVKWLRSRTGPIAAPDTAWLVLRGLRTLEVRVRRQSESALDLARRLAGHPAVERVRYPGLGDVLAARYMSGGFGGLLSFDVAGDARRVERSTRLITNATSLGGVESVLETRHRWEGDRVPENLIRLSVGLEDVDALWADLEQALE
jgi:cystathionine beta-lyase/cystathionine gamma-synthase